MSEASTLIENRTAHRPSAAAEGAIPVTVVVPAKNEERNLPECLASLGDFSEVMLVDSGSTDRTIEIAEAAGARVVRFEWNGQFPKKRNWALRTQSFANAWVLFLDADERIGPQAADEIRQAVSRDDKVGYWLNYDNHFMGRVLRHGVPQRKLALFRVGAGEYERIEDQRWSAFDMEIHEHPILSGAVGEVQARLEHKDYRGLHHFIARHNEYSTWEARRLAALRGDPAAWRALTARQRFKYRNLTSWWFAPFYFLLNYVAKAGFLDGRAGLFYSILKSEYFFSIRAKALEQAAERASVSR